MAAGRKDDRRGTAAQRTDTDTDPPARQDRDTGNWDPCYSWIIRPSIRPNPEQAGVTLPAEHRPCQATSYQLPVKGRVLGAAGNTGLEQPIQKGQSGPVGLLGTGLGE